MCTDATRFDQVALRLALRGWRPIPVYAATKQPCLLGWGGLCRDQWDNEALSAAVFPGGQFAGSGYACAIAAPADLLLLDLDIEDETQAQRVAMLADGFLGETPLVRVGRSPKQARIYRNADPAVRTRRLHPIEIMSGSGCLIVFGLHAITGQPYAWVRGVSPLDIDADDPRIPAVTALALEEFRAKVFAVVPRTARGALGLKPRIFKRRFPTFVIDAGGLHDELRQRARLVGFDRAVRDFLRQDTEGIRNEVGFAAVAACAGRGWSADEIRALFREHWGGWEGFTEKQLESAIGRFVEQVRLDRQSTPVRIEFARARPVFKRAAGR